MVTKRGSAMKDADGLVFGSLGHRSTVIHVTCYALMKRQFIHVRTRRYRSLHHGMGLLA